MSNNPPPPPGTGPQGPGTPGYGPHGPAYGPGPVGPGGPGSGPGGPGYPNGPGAPGYGSGPQGAGYGPGGRPPQGPGGPGYPAGPGGPGYPAPPGGPGYGPGGQPPQGPGGPGYGSAGQPPQGPGGPGYGPGGPPPQGPGGPGYPPGGHDTVAFGGTPTGPDPSRPRHRGRNIAIITGVLVLLFGGGAFALYKADPFNLFTSGPQAAEAFPANTLAYAAIDLDPSAQQKVNALRFLNHFPAFRESSGLTDENADVRKQVLGDAIDSLGCQGVTYDDSVKPWLGQKFGIGLVPAADGADPTPVVALEVTDRTEAKTAFNDLLGCGPSSGFMDVGYAFVGDYVLISESQGDADAIADSTAKSSLADNDDFKNDMDSLGGLGVATAWVDVAGTLDSYADQIPPELMTGGQGLDLLKQNYQRAAVTFRFESDHVEVVGSIFGDTPDTDHDDNPIVDLPDSTVFALSESGGAERVKSAWQDILDAAAAQGGDTQQQIDDFEAQTGLTLPDDLETVLGDNLLFAVDGEGLTADAVESEDLSQFNAGARFTTDPDAFNAIYDQIMTLLDQSGATGINIAKVDSDDGVTLASNDSYADSLSKLDGDLGSSSEFQSVTNDAESQEFVMFFNWDAVEDQVVEAMTNQGADPDEIENVTPLRAMGISSETDGDYTVSTLQISVND